MDESSEDRIFLLIHRYKVMESLKGLKIRASVKD